MLPRYFLDFYKTNLLLTLDLLASWDLDVYQQLQLEAAKLHSEHAILMAECSFASHCNFGMFVMLQGLQFTCLLNNYWLPSTDANMSTWCLHLVYELCIHVISFYSVLILSSTKAPTFSALDLRDTLVVTIVCSRSQFIWSFMLYCVWI